MDSEGNKGQARGVNQAHKHNTVFSEKPYEKDMGPIWMDSEGNKGQARGVNQAHKHNTVFSEKPYEKDMRHVQVQSFEMNHSGQQ
jgi:hypothetical protein